MNRLNYKIRKLNNDELDILKELLYVAIYVPAGEKLPPKDIIYNKGILVYIDKFYEKPDDYCLVSMYDDIIMGGVWLRKIKNAYGYIDDETPELSISILPKYQGLGIGTVLLNEIIKYAKLKGYQNISLSVDSENYAFKLYQKLGFKVVLTKGKSYIMALKIDG